LAKRQTGAAPVVVVSTSYIELEYYLTSIE
jgi:hypothetical protein